MLLHELTRQVLKSGDVGIEVEVEFVKDFVPLKTINGNIWHTVEDHSLKNGMEYILRHPIKDDERKLDRIKLLTDSIPKEKVVHNSPRTSVHVHVNVGGLKPEQIWSAAIAYWMVENVLMNYCGKETRVGNHFCLRLADAEGILNLCYTDLVSKRPFQSFSVEKSKYSGLNLSCLVRKNSLEFRGMAGTLDPLIIDEWSSAVHYLVQKAAAFQHPENLMDFYFSTEKDAFLYSVLPSDFILKLKESNPDYSKLIKSNISRLGKLAYFHDDWIAWSNSLEKTYDKKSLTMEDSDDLFAPL